MAMLNISTSVLLNTPWACPERSFMNFLSGFLRRGPAVENAPRKSSATGRFLPHVFLFGQADRFTGVRRAQAAPDPVGALHSGRRSAPTRRADGGDRRVAGVDVLADEVDRSVPHHDVTAAGVETAGGPDSVTGVAGGVRAAGLVRRQNRIDAAVIAATVHPPVPAAAIAPFADRSGVAHQQDPGREELGTQRIDRVGTFLGP